MTEKLATPAPLGLLGYGVTVTLLCLSIAGLFPLDTMILAMILSYAGLSQVIVGLMEFRKGNTFCTVAFTSYGMFWWSFALLLLLPNTTFFTGLQPPSAIAMAAYFFMWGLFTFAMFFGTLKTNRVLQFMFATLALLFFLLTLRDLVGNPVLFGTVTLNTIIGIEGIISGLSAIYLAIAAVLNETYDRIVLPICPTE